MNRILLLLGLFAMGPLNAQHYTRDGGIRIGDSFTATIRQHTDDEQALEGLLYIGRGGMSITILKEYFKPALSQISGNLFFMYGFGAHVGFRIWTIMKYSTELTGWMNGDSPIAGY